VKAKQTMPSPLFWYYGGKWRDAVKNYQAPKFDTIVEPFAGSAGYSLRYPDRDVILCDKDPIIAALWRYMIGVSERDILALPDIPNGGTVDDLAVPQEAKWLIGFRINAGVARPAKKPGSWMRLGRRPKSFWCSDVRQRIAASLRHIRHWKIVEGSYADLPMREATWFVDPPYQLAGKHYKHGASGIDFDHLGEWCRSLPGQAIVCENEGAAWLPFKTIGAVMSARNGKPSIEAMWTNDATALTGLTPTNDNAPQLTIGWP
jgi:hypothetical protein